MSQKTLVVPSIVQFADRIMQASVRFGSRTEQLRSLIDEDRRAAEQRRNGDGHTIFCVFAAALLERNVSGSSYQRRVGVFTCKFGDPRALTPEHAKSMIKESGYRFPETGTRVLLELTAHLASPTFSWPAYFAEAEARWEDGFKDDPLFKINGIGPKTRNFALSEFLDHYCAPDLHVCRMMARTGLILHGYGDSAFSTDNPEFVRKVIVSLSKETGFPDRPGSLSPAFLDRMFWYYGQDRKRCDADPDCPECPGRDICLTGSSR